MASNIVPQKKKEFTIGVPVYVIGALLVIGAAIFLYMQYAAKQAPADLPLTPEAREYVKNLQLSDVSMKATDSYMNQRVVEINGKITNAGDRPLDVVEIYCIFYDTYNLMVLRQRVPIVSRRMGGLKPGETKSFRLPFDEIPSSWNQATPSMVIAGVKFS